MGAVFCYLLWFIGEPAVHSEQPANGGRGRVDGAGAVRGGEPGATGIAVGTACPVCRDVAGKLYGKHNEAILKCGKCVVFWYNVAERQDFVEQ